MNGKGWFLGAYAGYASFAEKNRANDADYLRGLEDLPHLAGLELPFYGDLSETRSDSFLRTLPKYWDYILTLLPGTMQSLSVQSEFGLASASSEGRKAAMSRMTLVHRRVHEINARCGRLAVRGVELHSAPSGGLATAEALFRSLEELSSWDWQGAKLLIEHCDVFQTDRPVIKGFLALKEELGVVNQLPVHMSLNWGRSALEERRPEAALEHIALSGAKLAAFFFSGTALQDPLYGSWTDSHVPLQLNAPTPWEPTCGLLTESCVTEVCLILNQSPDILLGIKVQPAPASLTLHQRLDFLAQQIIGFEKARSAGSFEAI